MSGIEMLRSARQDVVQLQSALTAVDAGLESVEQAAEAAVSAGRGFRRALPALVGLGLACLIVGVVTVAVRSGRDDEVEPVQPEPVA